MKIQNLKELQKLIQLCRKTNVHTIKVDGIELTLGPLPRASQSHSIDLDAFPEANIAVPQYTPGNITEDTPIETDELTEEQLMYYSARPEELPEQAQ